LIECVDKLDKSMRPPMLRMLAERIRQLEPEDRANAADKLRAAASRSGSACKKEMARILDVVLKQ
jgi:hypothetical protein